ncbi:hypothetical protein ACQEU8_19220 [Streptomyces sp. CA-250714]|uniref:hypothetical protein n=1 Tax=Streptomyces sp. CA-250714 TaxID=3240060 RepID=UPI003D902245
MMRDRVRWSAGLALVTALGCLAGVPSAQAEDEPRPTDATLLKKCDNGTKSCTFHPSGPATDYRGDDRQVGDFAYNCTSLPQRSGITWSDTTEQSNSLGLSMTVGTGWSGVFMVSVTTSYERTWKKAHTESATTFVDVRPGKVGWVERAPRMQKVKGTYELIFKDEFHGRRYWYVPFTAKAPVGTSVKSQHTRPMTKKEKATLCS